METAKVDIRKLQTLNDCINRTIEALNQVRLSVHGAGPQGFGMVPGIGGIAHAAAGGYYPQFSQFPQVGSYGRGGGPVRRAVRCFALREPRRHEPARVLVAAGPRPHGRRVGVRLR